MKKWIACFLLIALVAFRIVWPLTQSHSNDFPNRPIKLVVPYLAGGGTDTFARILQKSLNKNNTLDVPIVIENRDGGSATIGSRFVKDSKPDGYRILCHHEGLIATQLAGVVPFGPADFRPVAQTGSIVLLMVVRADSPYQNLPELLSAAQQEPDKIRIGANQGSPAYFICQRLLEEYPGARFNYVSASGSKRITYILGGKLEAGIFSLAEFLSFRKKESAPLDDNIRALANFSESRNQAIPAVATSREQGLKTSASNAYYIWAPKDLSDSINDRLADAFEKAMQDPATLKELNNLALEPTFRRGNELIEHLEKRSQDFEKLAVEVKNPLPNLVGWFTFVTGVLFVLTLVLPSAGSSSEQQSRIQSPVSRRRWSCFAGIVIYLLLLQWSFPFWIATTLLLAVFSQVLQPDAARHLTSRNRPWAALYRLLFSLAFTLALEYLFTQVFFVPLP